MTFGQATDVEIDQRRRETLAYLRPVEEPEDLGLEPRHMEYMQAIRDLPEMPATKRDKHLFGPSGPGGMGKRLRVKLKGNNLIREDWVSPKGGKGRAYVQLYLTEKGQRVLEQLETRWKQEPGGGNKNPERKQELVGVA